jgi:squalene cyclase
MYGHGFAALFLSETYGMALRADLRERLAEAIELIVRTQNDEGGWRYQPRPRDADLSVTVCQVMALRAARNAGFAVPKATIDRALDYVKACQNPDGGFRYMRSGGAPSVMGTQGGSQFARSAAGVVAYTNGGIYVGPDLARGLAYLDDFRPDLAPAGPRAGQREPYYFYGHYYAVQAMWHAGGQRWRAWYPAIRNQLLARQLDDGSWADAICTEYGTAMALIILQVPNNYLPILQR